MGGDLGGERELVDRRTTQRFVQMLVRGGMELAWHSQQVRDGSQSVGGIARSGMTGQC